MIIEVPISVGEYIDKVTILRIKKERIKDKNKLRHVTTELRMLEAMWPASLPKEDILFDSLRSVNEQLWNNSEARKKIINTKKRPIGVYFVVLCFIESELNDKRHVIKSQIDKKFKSGIREQKGYTWINTSF